MCNKAPEKGTTCWSASDVMQPHPGDVTNPLTWLELTAIRKAESERLEAAVAAATADLAPPAGAASLAQKPLLVLLLEYVHTRWW